MVTRTEFPNEDSSYHRATSHKTGNNWPCGFLEVKNVKLLHDGPRQIAIGHLSEIKYTEYWILCQFGIESQHDILNR